MIKLPSFLVNGLKIIATSLLGGAIGIAFGFFLVANFIPFWKHYDIPSTPEKTLRIMYVDYQSTLDNPTNDILYVKSVSGKIHFISVLQENWQTLMSLPNSEISQIRLKDGYANSPIVATTKQGNFYQLFNGQWEAIPSLKEPWGWEAERDSCATQWQDHPLITKGVIDSAGIRFERPLSTILRCYILLDDGSIQAWTRETNLFNLMETAGTCAIIGIVIGILGGSFIVIRSQKRKIESVIT